MPSAQRFNTVTWIICFIAAIGFAFDIYELLMLPLIIRPALLELGNIQPGTDRFVFWFNTLMYLPAVAGGIVGLWGGYLTDLLGRRRVLTWSILLYAFSAFAAGYSTSLGMLLLFRCLVFIGVCVEFVAAVAWLAELFDDPTQRESVLGFTQAFSSVGGILVAFANGIAQAWAVGSSAPLLFGASLPAVQLPAIHMPEFLGFLGDIGNEHAPWRYTLMSGIVPAIPLILIRPFLPESPQWQKKRDSGTLRRPSIIALFAPELRWTTFITTLMFTCSLAAAFGAIQQMQQIAPGVPEVRAEVDAAMAKEFPKEKQEAMRTQLKAEGKTDEEIRIAIRAAEGKIKSPIEQKRATHATKIQETGGLAGRFAIAILMVYIAGRGKLLRMFLIPGLVVMPIVFGWAAVTSLHYLEIGMFFAGFFTVAQLSFWGNYLPHVYPVHLRGTGESFAANIGGRMLGTCFAPITQSIAFYLLPSSEAYPARLAYTAAGVAFFVYLVNLIASFWLPEPKTGQIHE